MGVHDTIRSTELVDQHGHAVKPLPEDTTSEEFASYFTEGPSTKHARHTVYYRHCLRFLRERFDESTESELVTARVTTNLEEYSKNLIEEGNISHILQDTGTPPGLGPKDFAAYTTADISPLLRIETEAEQLIGEVDDFDAFESAFIERLESALSADYIGLKSIVAYRTGLGVKEPSRDEAKTTFAEVNDTWNGRLENAVLNDYCVNLAADVAADHDAPMQFHTGFGDNDAHPLGVDPGKLYNFIKSHPETEVVLLHASYPYPQKAGYIVSVLENAYLDLGMTIPFIQHGVSRLLQQVLELAPTTKIVYSSDGFVIPEWYYFASRQIRTDLTTVLTELVEDGIISESYAEEVATNILRDNARRLYDL